MAAAMAAAAAAGGKKAFDLLVIGGGSGGVRASRIAAGYGARVALCELQAEHGPPLYAALGGTCVNVGCVPKKLMMYGSQFPNAFEMSRAYGWDVPATAFVAPDWKGMLRRKDEELRRLNGVYQRMLTGAGVQLLNGRGSLVDERTVRVGDEVYTADKVGHKAGWEAERRAAIPDVA